MQRQVAEDFINNAIRAVEQESPIERACHSLTCAADGITREVYNRSSITDDERAQLIGTLTADLERLDKLKFFLSHYRDLESS